MFGAPVQPLHPQRDHKKERHRRPHHRSVQAGLFLLLPPLRTPLTCQLFIWNVPVTNGVIALTIAAEIRTSNTAPPFYHPINKIQACFSTYVVPSDFGVPREAPFCFPQCNRSGNTVDDSCCQIPFPPANAHEVGFEEVSFC